MPVRSYPHGKNSVGPKNFLKHCFKQAIRKEGVQINVVEMYFELENGGLAVAPGCCIDNLGRSVFEPVLFVQNHAGAEDFTWSLLDYAVGEYINLHNHERGWWGFSRSEILAQSVGTIHVMPATGRIWLRVYKNNKGHCYFFERHYEAEELLRING